MKGMHIGLLSMAVMLTIIAGVFLSAEQITQGHLGLLMLALIVVAIMLGFPTAFTLMGLGMIFGYMAFYTPGQPFWQNSVFDLMVQRTYGVMTNDVLIAVPLFVFMGYIVERSNIVDRLFHSIQLAMRNVPGSLAVATIITCAVFATATGIIGAVVTLMGLLALRPMLKAGYDVKLAAGSITAGGCLGILIPPSILLILYGATAGVSVVRLYAGALLPGIMLAGLYVAYVMIRAKLNPRAGAAVAEKPDGRAGVAGVQELLTSFLPLMALILTVLGSIIFGLATPTEAAALGSLGGIGLAAAYRQLTWTRLKESVFLTARTTAMVCWLFVGSALFSATFALLGGQQIIEQWVLSLSLTPLQFMLLSQVIISCLAGRWSGPRSSSSSCRSSCRC